MSNLANAVNDALKKMHSHSATEKGSYGEVAVFKICESLYQKEGGILIWSYAFRTDKELAGNIKKENGRLFIERTGDMTEIDVLYVSRYRVFPIEVKAYRANTITLRDDSISGCNVTHKSPVHQNEMHARHMYSHIFKSLPEGNPDYIIPIVCMVDKTTLVDDRSDWQREYIKACVLNQLYGIIIELNKPMNYQINLVAMDKVLREAMVSNGKYLPPRS